LKSNIVETSLGVKPNVDSKDNIVGFGVSKLGDNGVDMTSYFFNKEK